jgi:hypothetical protein
MKYMNTRLAFSAFAFSIVLDWHAEAATLTPLIAQTTREIQATSFGGSQDIPYYNQFGIFYQLAASEFANSYANAFQSSDIEVLPEGLYATAEESVAASGNGAGGNSTLSLWFSVSGAGSGVPFTLQVYTVPTAGNSSWVDFSGPRITGYDPEVGTRFGFVDSDPDFGSISGLLGDGTYRLNSAVSNGQANFTLTVGTVPEPSVWAFSAFGSLGLCLRRCRNARNG